MYLSKEIKEKIFKKYGKSKSDTGSTEGQIALFSYRINHLSEHLKNNRKDFNTERSLVGLVGKRKSLLNYLKSKDIERYRSIIKELGIRK
ncbi:MAG: 30S ribosomal protein S15 [Flavobacteriaceae bacterium]|jgi:small subunit ribosomal protein S15|nr:30S ribosomal protein S15 [Flavobacteriaceae bacterium]MBQ22867.1 30S ribosomal protein S15 [Flavobacteriales bacterium]|tara:strand:+ start:1999 stop:2268 length:270 start_codon:yes stop_codon:yes gene_type:complete